METPRSSSSASSSEGAEMMDLVFLGATALLVWASVWYVRRCDRV
jgi:hypothetical protein